MLLLKIANNNTNLSVDYFIKMVCKFYQITLKKKKKLIINCLNNLYKILTIL